MHKNNEVQLYIFHKNKYLVDILVVKLYNMTRQTRRLRKEFQ